MSNPVRAAGATSRADRASLLGYCMGGNLALLALASQELPCGAW